MGKPASLAAFFCGVWSLCGTNAYLPAVGPAPLRFAALPAPASEQAWRLALLAKSLARTNSATITTNTASTATTPAMPADSTNTLTLMPPAPSGETNSMTPVDPIPFPTSWGDSFDPATPQTWTDFFRTAPGQRFAGPRSQQPRFIPPVPKPAPDAHASGKTP